MMDASYNGANQTFDISCPTPTYPCNSITSITCNNPVTVVNDQGLGLLDPSGSTRYPGLETIFEFTPTITGNYWLGNIVSNTYNSVGYFVKEAAGGCNNNNWNLIGTFYGYGGEGTGFPIVLNAGTSYYILADGTTPGQTFTITCPDATYDPCSSIVNIPDCNVSVNTVHPAGLGAFNLSTPNVYNSSTPGKENIFSFTPSVSGLFGLQVESGGTGIISYYIKNASDGCGNSGWQYIGVQYGLLSKLPFSLTAGTTYYILADPQNIDGASQTFSMVCPSPDPCNSITTINSCGWENPTQVTLPAGIGTYNLTVCQNRGGSYATSIDGTSKIFSYTPSVNGLYSISVNNYNQYLGNLFFYVKKASDGCNGENWICMTGDSYYGSYYSPFPLLKNTAYYILAVQSDPAFEGTFNFYLNCPTGDVLYADADGDGYGNPAAPSYGNVLPVFGYVYDNTDCNDNNPNVHPGAPEICSNHIDDNCNGLIDEGCGCTITISCPGNISDNTTFLSCNKRIKTTNPVIGGSCVLSKLTWIMTGATTGHSPSTGINNVGDKIFNTGITTITYTVSDASDKTAKCSFTVTIVDNIKPIILCPFNIKQDASGHNCSRSIAVLKPIIFDNCGVTKLTWVMTDATTGSSPSAGINYVGTKTFNAGVTTVTYTASDAANNVSTCSFTVKVNGSLKCNVSNSGTNTPGAINPKDGTLEINGGLSVNIFPNPTNTYFNLEMISGNNNEKLEITVFDVNGRMLKKINSEPYQLVHFGDNLIQGFYLVEVKQGTNRQIVKVVKQ